MSTDLSPTILAKSDQLNADDLQGRTLTIKVTKVNVAVSEQPVTINYEGDGGKPYKPGKSMRWVLSKLWGTEGKNYAGRSMTLYCDPTVKFGGLEVGGIRISHMSHITKPETMALTMSKGKKKPFTVKPLAAGTDEQPPAQLKADGSAAASKGSEAYKAWKDSLSPDQKEKIKPLHSQWSKEAIAADEQNKKPEPASSPVPPRADLRDVPLDIPFEAPFDGDESPI